MCDVTPTDLAHLKNLYPGRSPQIDTLTDLLSIYNNLEAPVPAIYVYGGPSTGKTSIMRSIINCCQTRHAYINMVECYTSRILFESILNQLMEHRVDPTTGEPYARCDNMMDFTIQLKKEEQQICGGIIVLDKAEELRNMDFNLLPGFLRLQELTGVQISVVFLSEIIFERYYAKSGVIEPIKVYFPQYNKDGLLEVLASDFHYAKALIAKNSDKSFNFDEDFYRNYLNVFLSVFYRVCRDLSELRHMARTNFLKYCKPILDGECGADDSMTLWRKIAPLLKSSLEVLYLRVSTDTIPEKNKTKTLNLELPFYAKYLLIAAYLASYNSAKDDKRLFMKNHGKKTKTSKDVKLKSKVSEQLNTQLGPKPFTLDRLLAIFYSILEDKVGFNNNLLVQVSSLVELQLLTAASDGCSLDGQKYKCSVSFDFIQAVSRMVGINVRKYLSDFSHM